MQVSGHRKFLRQTENCAPAHTADAGGCGERFESPGTGSPNSEPAAFPSPPAERFSLERKKHTKTQKLRWFEHTIGPKTGKVDDFRLFPQNPSTFTKQEKPKVDGFYPFPRNPSTFTKQANRKVDDFQLFPQNPSTFTKQANRKVDDFHPFP